MPKKKRKHDVELTFDIRKVTDDEWNEFENEYIEAVQMIVVPEDLRPRDILAINSEVDYIYSQARFDYAYAKRMLTYYEQRLSNAKKTSKLVFTKQRGKTESDREAFIIQHLETVPIQGDKEPIYTLVDRWQTRTIFMEAVIDNLLKKTDKMISGNGALKLDAQGRGNNE